MNTYSLLWAMCLLTQDYVEKLCADHLRPDRNSTRLATSCGGRVDPYAGMFRPPFKIRHVSSSVDSEPPIRVKSGPRWPPTPAMVWQFRQPRCWNDRAPCAAVDERPVVTDAGKARLV